MHVIAFDAAVMLLKNSFIFSQLFYEFIFFFFYIIINIPQITYSISDRFICQRLV